VRKKLIEVALPLEAINREAAREKSIRQGHPSTLHLWWARRPLAACRAVLFASLIDDPDQEGVPEALLKRIDELPLPSDRGPEWSNLPPGEQRRKRLFAFIERLVKWENSSDESVLETSHELIHAATGGNPPSVLDPFCGGGAIPLEAHRLGLAVQAGDLNPVAVLITRALIQIPQQFRNCPPVNPRDRKAGMGVNWRNAAGLAADVRYYGEWMRRQAESRVGHLYPTVGLPAEHGGGTASVIAWFWARTVKCPNPACGAEMPLIRSFLLSTKPGRKTWLHPVIDQLHKTVQFKIQSGAGAPRDGTVSRQGATCLVCNAPAPLAYVRTEAQAGRMGLRLTAAVAETPKGRTYVPAQADHEAIALSVKPKWSPDQRVTTPSHDVDRLPMYGLYTWGDAFTRRQLGTLTTLSDLISEVRREIENDAVGSPNAAVRSGISYTDALATYLAFCIDKMTEYNSSLVRWYTKEDRLIGMFARQAIPMVWDFVEINPFSRFGGSVDAVVRIVSDVLSRHTTSEADADVEQRDAVTGLEARPEHAIISTDPPYYDNIGYADLSDFFYVWLRHSLGDVYPNLFGTMLTPKQDELVASSHRFDGNKEKAQRFFEQGLGKAFSHMRSAQHPDYPLTVFYAFKQAETDEPDDERSSGVAVASTGWETMLSGLLGAGFAVTGTWPMRSELGNRMIASGTNALASSIVLVCRPRPASAPIATRREFLAALKQELPDALRKLQHGNVAPVDLAQAAIGPGMAVFSRYSKVMDASGKALSIRTALQIINQVLDEVLVEQESEYDPATRWAVAWFEQFGLNEGLFGDAETLSKAKDVAVARLEEAGILRARGGKVRLLRRDELPPDWDPTKDRRIAVWEIAQHLIRAQQSEGDAGAASLLVKVGGLGEIARDLAYRLYVTCERKGWAQEALAFNGLVVAWPDIARLATAAPTAPAQGRLI
jgi:putative DNA methylase